jgi:hypothetical protein
VLEIGRQHVAGKLLGIGDPEALAVLAPLKALVLAGHLVGHLVELAEEWREHAGGHAAWATQQR